MRPVSIQFAAAADGRAVSIDRDTVLSSMVSDATCVVSTDPARTIANTINTPANEQLSSVIGLLKSQSIQLVADFPLSAGEQIFVSCSAPAYVLLYFTDPV